MSAQVLDQPATARIPVLPATPPAGGTGATTFRADIQGLRAVAVGVVVLYHAGLPWLPGGYVGVDVFFVLSGFLITQGLVTELERRGTVSLAGFYARRARRILPAAAVALLGTAALTVAFLPQQRWLQVAQDVVQSSIYLVNWDLADRAVDYSARDQAASPLQHFWSLAVEEQFYVVWPLAILAVVGLVRLARRARPASVRPVGISRLHLVVPLLLIAVPSLAWSISLSATDPGRAYFVTTTRMWELALGAALAVVPVVAPASARVSRAVGWAGLAAIGWAAATFDATTVFPGSAALLPTLGAVAVLWSALSGEARRQNPLLRTRPMTWIGTLSYSLYLWHWPLLVIATAQTADGDLRLRWGLLLVAAAVVPAWVSLKLVERPVLSSPALRRSAGPALLLGAVCTLVALVAGLGLRDHQRTTAAETVTPVFDPSITPGAAAVRWDAANGSPQDSFPVIVPAPTVAFGDVPVLDGHGCVIDQGSVAANPCSFGNLASGTRIALVGDSHADQYVPAVEAAAVERGWRLDVYTRGSCPFNALTVDLDGAPNLPCDAHVDNVTAALLADPPDALLVAGSRYQASVADGPIPSLEDSKPLLAQGYRDAWAPFVAAGIPVVSIRDTPRPDVLVPECVAANEDQLSRCAHDRDAIVWEDGPEVTAATGNPGVELLDLTRWICPAESCPAVIGGVVVYRDGNHLTATYARTLGSMVSDELAPLLG
jgi:peptidoglycan/LPS O-acetylase OafA/YrhL